MPNDFVRKQRGFNPSVRCKPLLEMAKATANMGVFDDHIYRILAKDCPTKKTLRFPLQNFQLTSVKLKDFYLNNVIMNFEKNKKFLANTERKESWRFIDVVKYRKS